MVDPVFDALKRGEQFPYQLLRNEFESVRAYWDWWWETQYQEGRLDRPKTLTDDDPLLTPTADKPFADTRTDDEYFSEPLRKCLRTNQLTMGDQVPREEYREEIVTAMLTKAPVCASRVVVFAGGGYGAGKTQTLQFLQRTPDFQMRMGTEFQSGVDYCKQLLPEFNLVKRMSDGRASEICQAESRLISDEFFRRAVLDGRNFGWDSSMSQQPPTLAKIEHARRHGYALDLVAVLTPLEIAKRRAMDRARETKRFPPPLYLEASHRDFCHHLPTYLPLFDRIFVVENSQDGEDPQMLAVKWGANEKLEIIDCNLLRRYVNYP